MSRAIQKYIEDPLAEEIIQSKLEEGDLISIKMDKKKENIEISIEKPKKKLKEKGKNKELPESSKDDTPEK